MSTRNSAPERVGEGASKVFLDEGHCGEAQFSQVKLVVVMVVVIVVLQQARKPRYFLVRLLLSVFSCSPSVH